MNLKSTVLGLILLAIGATSWANPHCEIPCGIYGDQLRIDLLKEDILTVEKSMENIKRLAEKSDPLSLNQAARWIQNKDEHAAKIQHIVTQYFLTQRIKPAKEEEFLQKYQAQLVTLHEMLIEAMRCKQTVDTKHTDRLRNLTAEFSGSYFSAEDRQHLREHDSQRGED